MISINTNQSVKWKKANILMVIQFLFIFLLYFSVYMDIDLYGDFFVLICLVELNFALFFIYIIFAIKRTNYKARLYFSISRLPILFVILGVSYLVYFEFSANWKPGKSTIIRKDDKGMIREINKVDFWGNPWDFTGKGWTRKCFNEKGEVTSVE